LGVGEGIAGLSLSLPLRVFSLSGMPPSRSVPLTESAPGRL